MGKTKDLFKKIGVIKGTFHSRMGMIKDRNGKDLTEAKEIRRGGKNIQNCTKKKKNLSNLDNHDVVMVWSLTYSRTSWSMKSSGP